MNEVIELEAYGEIGATLQPFYSICALLLSLLKVFLFLSKL